MAANVSTGAASGGSKAAPWYNDRQTLGMGGTAVGFGGSALGVYLGYKADKTQAKAMAANAASVRKQAQADREAGVAGELTQRRNQNNAMGVARAAQAVSGFTDQGSGAAREIDTATMYEHAIAQSAAQRDNRYSSALDQAAMLDWQASVMKKAAKTKMFGGMAEAIGKAALGASNFA